MDHGLPPRRVLPPPVPPTRHAAPAGAPTVEPTAAHEDDETSYVSDDAPPLDVAEDDSNDEVTDLEAPATGSHRVLVMRPSRKRWIPAGAGGVLAAIAAAVVLSTGMLEQQPAPAADEAAVTEAAVPSASVTTPPAPMPAVPTIDLTPGTPGAGAGGPATGRSSTAAVPTMTQAPRPAPVVTTPSVAVPPPASSTASSVPVVEAAPSTPVDTDPPAEAPVVTTPATTSGAAPSS